MAQPHDIEDVLSSIRRLVANDSGAGPAMTATATATVPEEGPTPPEDEAPALVLDPAQRVTDPEDPFQMIRSLAQEERDARDAEFVMAQVEEQATAITTDIITEVLEADMPWTGDNELPDDYREDTDYQGEEDVAAEATDTQAEDTPAMVAEIEAAPLAEPDDVSEIDLAPDNAVEAGLTEAEFDTAEPEAANDGAEQSLDSEPQISLQQDGDDNTADDGVPHQETSSWDVTETSDNEPVDADAEPDSAAADQAENDDLADLSEAIGSDDALRELIAEIVRQELSGALGERITRNVRKLVRREIRQMLSSGEFD